MNSEKENLMYERRIRKISKDEYGVHAAHCCSKHGCKYGDDNCPVCDGTIEQKYPCIDCYDDNPLEPPLERDVIGGVVVNSNKEFLKGMISAFLIIILLHIGWSYVLLF